MLIYLGSTITTRLYRFLDGTIFYFLGGRRAEKRADLYAVKLGYGYGLYRMLYSEKYDFSLSALFDVHPQSKTRTQYIKDKMIMTYGKKYWQILEESYA